MMGSNSAFNSAKRKSTPIVKIPKNVKQMLNIAQVYEDGIFQLEEKGNRKLFDVCFAFEDINYVNEDHYKQEQILMKLCTFLNSMDAEFKISICNEFQDMDALIEELYVAKNEANPLLEAGMKEWVVDKASKGNANVKKARYIIVTTRTKDHKDAGAYFLMLEHQLRVLFNSWKSRLIRLDVHARLRTLQEFLRTDCHYEKGNLNQFKNDILPSSVKQHKNYLELGDTCASILYASQFQSTIKENEFLYRLTTLEFPSILTVDYAPIPSAALQGKVDNAYTGSEVSITREQEMKAHKGLLNMGVSYSKNKIKTELENLSDQIDRNDERGFFIGVLIMVFAKDEYQLRERLDHVIAIGREQKVRLDIYNYQQLKALNTVLPFAGRQVDHMRTMLTTSAVGIQPYHAVDVIEPGGHIYGLNLTTNKPIVGDRKKLKNPHGIIVAHTGGGKSMLIKTTEISQSILFSDDDVILIDPQNEAKEVVRAFGGEYIDFTPKSKLNMNPLEIPEDLMYASKSQQDYFVSKQTEYLIAFVRSTMREIDVNGIYDGVVGRCNRKMYEKAFQKKKQPTLIHFRKEIEQEMKSAQDSMDQVMTKEIYASLEEYTEGAYDMFAKPSNISLNNRLMGFGIKQVSESNWETVMLTIMNFLANRMEFNKKYQRATRLIIDETQVVCESDSSAQMLLKAVVTFRKFGGICTFAIQNMTKALEHPKLRDMFSNCEFKVFFDQGGMDAKVLAEIQELSEIEFQALQEEKPGCGVMVWGKKVLLLDAFMKSTNPLYELFSTNFHEKAEKNVPKFGTNTERIEA